MDRYFRIALVCIVTAITSVASAAAGNVETSQRIELLWPEGAPGAKGDAEGDKPTLTIYLPPDQNATGAAVVICPGGGYGHLAVDHEGHQIAKWLNTLGVAGFIVKYRHRNSGAGYGHPAPLLDAQRAVRMVRSRAAEWGVDPGRIGILGFSAGGHLASTAGTHFDNGDPNAKDPIDRAGCRPDFMVLVYPVISLVEPYAHAGSRQNLLGKEPDPNLVEYLSNEKQVTPQTPPAFLIHTYEDTAVPAENSIYFYLALRRAKVPAEMHLYQKGPHGFGLGKDIGPASSWPTRCADWMRGLELLAAKENKAEQQ
jgi:acetyl esterase/lipase